MKMRGETSTNVTFKAHDFCSRKGMFPVVQIQEKNKWGVVIPISTIFPASPFVKFFDPAISPRPALCSSLITSFPLPSALDWTTHKPLDRRLIFINLCIFLGLLL